jgi:hypothetical protein
VPARRERGFRSVAERRRGAAAVGLVSDDDDRPRVIVGDGAHVLGCGTRREPLVDRRDAEAELGRRLPRAEQRARHDCLRLEAGAAEPFAERARLRAALGGQRAQLVGLSRGRLGMSNDHEAHGGQDNPRVLDDYLLLGLRLGRHVDGFVDAYYGPPELSEQVEREELVEPATLVADAVRLAEETDDAWLLAQLAGCETTARRLAGEPITWEEEVTRCYGVRPDRTEESVFAAAHEKLDRVLRGDGELGDRYRAWQETQVLPPGRVLEAAQELQEILRARALELFGLPDGETCEIELVQNEPWAGFNYYLGGRRSRVVVNTDLPVYRHTLPGLVAHEVYPGHHAEHSWKEAVLVDGEGRLEETIQLTGTPQAVISEGIAMLAPEIVGAYDVAGDVYGALDIDYDAQTSDAVRSAREDLAGVSVNAARRLHLDGATNDEVSDYLVRWNLLPREHAAKALEFYTHPAWRAYISSYSSGYELCKAWVGDDTARFKRLLTERLSTRDLQA